MARVPGPDDAGFLAGTLAEEWPAVAADAVAFGAAEFDERGRLRIVVP